MNISISKVIIVPIVIVLTLAASASIYSTIVKFRSIPFPYDSAGHAYEGLRIAQDLKTGDIISFLADTYRQAFWPFFHSWLLAPAFILFGNTYSVARSVSLVCFMLFIPTIYFIGNEMSDRGHWAGLISVCLAVTSLPLLVLSAMSMSEIPGLLMTFITFLFYLKAIKHENLNLFIFTGILMGLTLFTKWHHGVFVIAAIVLTQVFRERKFLSKNNYYLFIPFSILIIGWFIYPRHLISFYEHSTFQPEYYRFFSFENWLFYPKSFVTVYHSSMVIAVIVAISFIFSLKRIKNPIIMLFAIHIFVGLILMTIKLDNRHRYIITIVPSVWILGAIQLTETLSNVKHRLNNKKIRIALFTIVILSSSLITLLSASKVYSKYSISLLNYNFYGDEKTNKAYDFISKNVKNHNHFTLFGIWDNYNSLKATTIKWNIEAGRANDFSKNKDKKKKARYYFQELLKNRNKESYYNFIHFLETKDITIKEYHMLSFMKMLNTKAYEDSRKKTTINPFSDKIIDLNSVDDNITCLIIIRNGKEPLLSSFADQVMAEQDEWTEYKSKLFSDLDITIIIYERKTAQLRAYHTDIYTFPT